MSRQRRAREGSATSYAPTWTWAPLVLGLAQVASSSPYDPFSVSARCPAPCSDPGVRSQYAHIDQLNACNQTVILDVHLYSSTPAVRACTLPVTHLDRRQLFAFPGDSNSSAAGSSAANVEQWRPDIRVSWTEDVTRDSSSDETEIAEAANALADWVQGTEDGHRAIVLAKSGSTVMGLYAGEQLSKKSVGQFARDFAGRRGGHAAAAQVAAQACGKDPSSTRVVGIFALRGGGLDRVRAALGRWNDAECVGPLEKEETWTDMRLDLVPGQEIPVGPDDAESDRLSKRATCKYTQVKAGDGCWALADRCNITQESLVKFNRKDLCSTLLVGDYVCCSSGDLPDFTPQPNPDGSCKTHQVDSGESCDAIARANSMTVSHINSRNKKTWGWAGCSALQPDQIICLSTGSPPMPAPIANAVCGPQVNGTKKPDDMDDLADLNPCPLKVCCNVWGQCGMNDDFCVPRPADTGAPGTAKPGSNGCISSCGTDIVNNDEPPATFRTVGYFEAWNLDRTCLHMLPSDIDTSHYTDIHFAFGSISTDFEVQLNELQDMFDDFKAIKGVSRIISFGGWSFSTDHDTFPIFREGVTAEERQTFANNVAKFVVEEGLDGVDFDWEYPGAPDIPGIPAGSPDDGKNYLSFLKLVREALPDDKTIGIAAPASYWYLKGFPIADMSKVVDYIIYMTYDLHGQWDYGNEWATDGCSEGNCLRHHTNQTETELSLAMVTKAGVPSGKVIVGMPMYGRSFKMTDPECHGPDCTYAGPDSAAAPGRCTDTRGYISNFEIREIIAAGGDSVQQLESEEGDDILVYDGVQWVGWMTEEKYVSRAKWVKELNFGGTSDWAMDLDVDYGSGGGSGGGDRGDGPVYVSPDIYESDDPLVGCVPPCTLVFPPWVLPSPTTISFPPSTVSYEENWETTSTADDGGVVTVPAASITTTVITIPPKTTTAIDIWNVVWDGKDDGEDGSNGTAVWLTSSIDIPPVTLTKTTRGGGETIPPVTWTYSPGPYPPHKTGKPDPPPLDFPSTVKVESDRPPKPTCVAGDNCGSKCRINCSPPDIDCVGICGCIGPFCGNGDDSCEGPFCDVGNCVGPGCSYVGGGGDGGGDGDDCRTKTVASSCEVPCTVFDFPATTSTTCRDERCERTVTGCDVTDVVTTTTTTLSCEAAFATVTYDPDDLAPTLYGTMPTASPEPPENPTAQAVIVFSDNRLQEKAFWSFFSPPIGVETASFACQSDEVHVDTDYIEHPTYDNIGYPSGTFNLDFPIKGMDGCTYAGRKGSPGQLTCPDLDRPVQCFKFTDLDNESGYGCSGVYYVFPKITCPWE